MRLTRLCALWRFSFLLPGRIVLYLHFFFPFFCRLCLCGRLARRRLLFTLVSCPLSLVGIPFGRAHRGNQPQLTAKLLARRRRRRGPPRASTGIWCQGYDGRPPGRGEMGRLRQQKGNMKRPSAKKREKEPNMEGSG